MPNLPDMANCRAVFASGMMFTGLHLEALRLAASKREPASLYERAKEFKLSMSQVRLYPYQRGVKASGSRVIGAYNTLEEAAACYMWLMHFDTVRNWGLHMDVIEFDFNAGGETISYSNHGMQKVEGSLSTVRYGEHGGERIKKLPDYTLIFPTPQAPRNAYHNPGTPKQYWSKAQKKFGLIQPGMRYGDFVTECKKIDGLKNRSALDWDIKRGYVHVVPA